jgi:hypothetical protein
VSLPSQGLYIRLSAIDAEQRSCDVRWFNNVEGLVFALAELGFLAGSPVHPNIAFSFGLLEFFYELQVTAFATQYAFVQTLAKTNQVRRPFKIVNSTAADTVRPRRHLTDIITAFSKMQCRHS